jgi:hypothetical protein
MLFQMTGARAQVFAASAISGRQGHESLKKGGGWEGLINWQRFCTASRVVLRCAGFGNKLTAGCCEPAA